MKISKLVAAVAVGGAVVAVFAAPAAAATPSNWIPNTTAPGNWIPNTTAPGNWIPNTASVAPDNWIP
jgi:hypothetical protein